MDFSIAHTSPLPPLTKSAWTRIMVTVEMVPSFFRLFFKKPQEPTPVFRGFLRAVFVKIIFPQLHAFPLNQWKHFLRFSDILIAFCVSRMTPTATQTEIYKKEMDKLHYESSSLEIKPDFVGHNERGRQRVVEELNHGTKEIPP